MVEFINASEKFIFSHRQSKLLLLRLKNHRNPTKHETFRKVVREIRI
jgi:hypothetical protein